MQESQGILDEIRTILKTARNESQQFSDSQKVRDLLQDLASDYEACNDYNPRRVEGTCEWFFTMRNSANGEIAASASSG